MIGATIRIGREMLCPPYAGYFAQALKQNKKTKYIHGFIVFQFWE